MTANVINIATRQTVEADPGEPRSSTLAIECAQDGIVPTDGMRYAVAALKALPSDQHRRTAYMVAQIEAMTAQIEAERDGEQ